MRAGIEECSLEDIRRRMYSGKLQDALRCISETDETQETQLLMAQIKIRLGLYNDVVEGLKNYLLSDTMDITCVNGLLLLGEAQHSLNKLEESSNTLATAAKLLSEKEGLDERDCMLELQMGSLEKKRGQLDKSYEHLNKGLSIAKELNLKRHLSEIKNFLGLYFFYIGEFDEADACLKEALQIQEKLEDDYLTSWTLNSMGVLYRSMGDSEQALKFLARSLKMREELGNPYSIAGTLNNIGMIYHDLSDLDKALDTYLKGIEISVKMASEFHEFVFCINIGIIYHRKGNLSSSLSYYTRSLELAENRGNKLELAGLLNNLGLLYMARGETREALDCFERSLQLKDETGNKLEYARVFQNIGLVHQLEGNQEEALQKFLVAIKMLEDIDNPFEIADSLFNIIQSLLTLERVKDAQVHVLRLREIGKNHSENRQILDRVQLVEGLLHMSTDRFKDKILAQNIFSEVFFEEDATDYNTQIFAGLRFADLLILELQTSWSSDVLTELNNTLDKLSEIATQQNSHSLLARALLMKGKLSIIELNIEDGLALLEKAESISKEHGLIDLALEISTQYDSIVDQKDVISSYSKDKDVQELVRIVDLDKGRKQLLEERGLEISLPKNESPLILLLLSKVDERVLYTHTFPATKEMNPEFIEVFVQSLLRFSERMFKRTIAVERIKFQEYSLIMKSYGSLIFCYLFDGPSFIALERLDNLATAIKVHIPLWNQLTQATKDLSPISENKLASLTCELFNPCIIDISKRDVVVEDTEGNLSEIHDSLFSFKNVLHPIRLAILRKLNAQYRIPFAELGSFLGMTKGRIKHHVEVLEKEQLIESKYEFIDAKPRLVLYLKPEGIQCYQGLQKALGALFSE
jgi:tetratricopeptide (TPR) repeat protein/DNA-binding MarR family transcriptional regulator